MLEKIKSWLKKPAKETWIMLIAAGMLLMIIALPTEKNSEDVSWKKEHAEDETGSPVSNSMEMQDRYAEYLERRIKAILKTVEGVGEADVLVVLKSSQEMVVWSDSSLSKSKTQENDGSGMSRTSESEDSTKTAVYTDKTGNVPFIQKQIYPEVNGIIITADGGADAVTVSEISEAIEALLGLAPHKIKVLKRG